ncbi:hypothetical protein ACFQ2C_17310 [Sphingobacterium daejeonense]|uniref:Lipoprotein n=1 Tax=Sphingobacterium daejeonense TaxID=371142 RepID=A0ABW3RQ50_9SPHI
MKSSYKISLLFVGLALLFSCSKNNIEPKPEPEPEPDTLYYNSKFELYVENSNSEGKQSLNIYEELVVKINFIDIQGEYSKPIIRSGFDSIVWKVPGVFSEKGRENSVLVGKGVVFAQPGAYTLFVQGYNKGEVICKDSVEFEVKNDRDFFGVNWKDKEDRHFSTYVENVNGFHLNNEYFYNNGVKYATLTGFSSNSSEGNNKMIKEKIHQTFNKFLTNLYGESKYEFKGNDYRKSDLMDEYKAIFKTEAREYSYPLKIWQTSKNNIAIMIEYFRNDPDDYWYIVKAEPRE